MLCPDFYHSHEPSSAASSTPCSIITADMNLDMNVPISSSIDSVDVDSSCVRVEVNSEEVKHKYTEQHGHMH